MPPLQAQIRLESELDLTEDLFQGAVAIMELSQATCPVDTGELQASHQALIAGRNHCTVYVAAEHASYVEQGTRYMDAQPYLGPALDLLLPEIMADLSQREATILQEQERAAESAGGVSGFDLLFPLAGLVAAELLRRGLQKQQATRPQFEQDEELELQP